MKKYIINTSFVLAIISIITLPTFMNSCKKTDTVEAINTIGQKVSVEPDGIMAYYNFITQKSDGVFAIKQYGSQATQDQSRSTQFGGFFMTKDGNALLGGDIKIGETILSADPTSNFMYGLKKNEGANLYGTNVHFSLNPNSIENSGSSDPGYDSLYVPEQISMLSPLYNNNSTIGIGTLVRWNIDTLDKKGIIILLEYDPELPQNTGVKVNGYTQKIYKAVTLADHLGSYSFVSGDFTGLPNNSKVIMSLGRANYKTIEDNNLLLKYSVYAYTIVESIHTLQF